MSKRRGGKEKNKEVSQAQRQRQALVLADSFDTFMRPLSLEQPRALFRLVNVPLIEYTLEYLASQKVDTIYVFCCAHAEMVENYIKSSRWNSTSVSVIPIITKADDMTAGNALREMNSKGFLRDDFILVYGDIVANIELDPIFNAHSERRRKDKECIITSVFKEARPGHRTRAYHDDTILAIDSFTNQILCYDANPSTRHVEIDLKNLGPHAHRSVQFRHDLIECGIYICSNEVLFQFQENFDYSNLIQFTKGVVSEEILGAKAHAHIVKGQYAARANCLRTFNAISFDIINRWIYPIVPDNNILDNSSYRIQRHAIYKERKVKLSQSCVIGEKTVIGENTVIGANTRITQSTIGRNCIIGENVKLKGAFLWDGVVIGDNATITDSILADRVQIRPGATINRGSVLSFGVIVGKDHVLPPFTKLISTKYSQTKEINLGEGGKGWVWVGSPIPAPVGAGSPSLTPEQVQQVLLAVSKELVPTDFEVHVIDTLENVDSDSDEVEESIWVSSRERFLKEVSETIFRTESEAVLDWIENVSFELRALKLAYDSSFLETSEAILLALIEFVPNNTSQFKKICQKWSPILKKFLDGPNRGEDEIELIFKIQEYIENKHQKAETFTSIISSIYSAGIIKPKTIYSWEEELEGGEGEDKSFVEEGKKLVQWIKEKEYGAGVYTDSDEDPVDSVVEKEGIVKRNMVVSVSGSGLYSSRDEKKEENGEKEDVKVGASAVGWGDDSYSGSSDD